MLEEGRYRSAGELAGAEGVTRSFVNRLLRLTLLAPDIVEAILDGRQPKGNAARRLDPGDADSVGGAAEKGWPCVTGATQHCGCSRLAEISGERRAATGVEQLLGGGLRLRLDAGTRMWEKCASPIGGSEPRRVAVWQPLPPSHPAE